jgi:hypothetical protein
VVRAAPCSKKRVRTTRSSGGNTPLFFLADVSIVRQAHNPHALVVTEPDLRNSEAGIDGKPVQRRAGDLYLNDQVRGRINGEVDFGFAANALDILNI